ncbi:MAG: hypothetical protein KAQ98_06850 [Bacteriovoracaceae bacterium]|nr:hypothetical protein [Bacteriovoracaceae bacterium]
MKLNLALPIIITVLILSGCVDTSRNVQDPEQTPAPIAYTHPQPTTTPAVRNPFPFSAFVAHGYPPSSIIWSTENEGVPSSVMVTDIRFDVRVKKEPGPAQGTFDKFNVNCQYITYPYTFLMGRVRIRASGSSNYKEMSFKTNPETGYSEVLRFGDLADFPQTTGHYVIEIVDPIQSDGGCVRDHPDHDHPDVCPQWTVPHTECYSMSVELATDYTDPF